MFVRYATTLPTLSVTPHPTSYRVGQGDRLSLQSLVFRIRLFEILGSVGRQVLGEAKGVSASGRVCTKSVQVFADILRFVLLQTRTPSHSTSQPRNTCKPRGPRPSTVKSFRPSSFLFALRPALTHEVVTRPSPELAWLSPWLEFWGEPLPAIASPARSCP